MTKTKFYLPVSYFSDPERAANSFFNNYKNIDYNFVNPDSAKILPDIILKITTDLSEVKKINRMFPDDCITLLESIINSDKKDFNMKIATISMIVHTLADEEQKTISRDLIKSLKNLRGYFEKDNRYVSLPNSINKKDKEKLLSITSDICFDITKSMIDYINDLSERANTSTIRR